MKKYLAIIALVAIAACSKSGKDTQQPPPPVGPTLPGTPRPVGNPIPNTETHKTIGTSGGTITSLDGAVTLTFPAGALSSDQNISIQKIESTVPMSMDKAYRFSPSMTFAKPVAVTFHYQASDMEGTAPQAVRIATQGTDGIWMKEKGTPDVDVVNHTITASINHFSDWAFFEAFSLTPAEKNVVGYQSTIFKLQYIPVNNEDLFVPLPGTPVKIGNGPFIGVKVNGQIRISATDPYGYISETHFDSAFKYTAPSKLPHDTAENIAIAADIDMSPFSIPGMKNPRFTLISYAKMTNPNSFAFDGLSFANTSGAGLVDASMVSVILSSPADPAKSLVIHIPGVIFHGAGNYTGSTVAISGATGTKDWGNSVVDPTQPDGHRYSSATVQITSVTNLEDNQKRIDGIVTGALIRMNGQASESTDITAKFAVISKN